jgi:hypothetical protein
MGPQQRDRVKVTVAGMVVHTSDANLSHFPVWHLVSLSRSILLQCQHLHRKSWESPPHRESPQLDEVFDRAAMSRLVNRGLAQREEGENGVSMGRG